MTNTYDSNSLWACRDFYLSSYLICEGFEMLKYEKDNDGFTTFIFEDSQLLQEHAHRYYSLQARTNPVAFSHAIKTLKTIINRERILTTNTNTNNYANNNKIKGTI